MTEKQRLLIHRSLQPAGAPPGGDHAARDTLSDLVSLAGLVAELSERAHRQLAARPTVTAHLDQAREHLAGLDRKLPAWTIGVSGGLLGPAGERSR